MIAEYKRFLLRGNVVDLAVGVVAGAAFGAVVNSMVGDVIMPLIAGVFGEPDFGGIVWNISGGEVRIGDFLNALVAFFLTMTGVFFLIVKPVNIATSRFMDDDEDTPRMRECPECLSEIPKLARRCGHCTTAVAPPA